MQRVQVRSIANPEKVEVVSPRDARILASTGKWEYADDVARAAAARPSPGGPNYAALPVPELRRLVRDRKLEGLSRAPKDELVAALAESDRAPARGQYQRRDLRAEE